MNASTIKASKGKINLKRCKSISHLTENTIYVMKLIRVVRFSNIICGPFIPMLPYGHIIVYGLKVRLLY